MQGGLLKTCKGCGAEKPWSQFSRCKGGRFGLRPRCKTCCAAEKALWRAANVERILRVNAEYRAKNRERCLAYNKAWNARNRDRCDAATERWRARNVDLVRAQRRRHRDLKRRAPGVAYASTEKIAARLVYYAGRCFYCRSVADTFDHRVPLSRGGSALPANLVPACRSCNSRKRAMTQREFQGVMPSAP